MSSGKLKKEIIFMTKAKIEELAKARQREYLRQWRIKNKEKVKKHTKDYWERLVIKEAGGKNGE